jgi:hypothetical protein
MSPIETRHARFAEILRLIERQGRVYFRHLRGQEYDDKMQEARALGWKKFERLEERGKDVMRFPTVFAQRIVQAAYNGRRVAGSDSKSDALSPLAQKTKGFTVGALPISTTRSMENLYSVVQGQQAMDAWEERLHENAVSPVLDQVAMRVDFPAWLATRTELDRHIIAELAKDERGKDIARKVGKSEGRISQLRSEYRIDWERFTNPD